MLLAVGMAGLATTLSQAAMVGTDVGNPTVKGSYLVNFGAGQVTITGGGNDIWNNSDNFYFVYQPMPAGDFDVKCRVTSIVGNSGDDNWSKAEIMARIPSTSGGAPAGGDPHFSNMATKTERNIIGQQARQARDGASMNPGATGPVAYPNVWLRMNRVGTEYRLAYGTDGNNWTWYATNTVDTATGWDAGFTDGRTINVGIAVTGHNDASSATAVIDNISGLELPTASTASGSAWAAGARIDVYSGATAIGTITSVLLDDTNNITSQITQSTFSGGRQVNWSTTSWLAAGPHKFTLSDGTQTVETTVAVPAWKLLPAEYALGGSPNGTTGINMDLYQINFVRVAGNENETGAAEQQWARGFIDPATKAAYVNVANTDSLAAANPLQYINLNGAMDGAWPVGTEVGTQIGSFTDPTFSNPDTTYTDTPIPGLPSEAASDPRTGTENGRKFNNLVAKFTAVVPMTAGFHRMAVNSDDGFKVSAGKAPDDVAGFVLGEFSGGKGASDVTFDYVVEQGGNYALRLLWWQGNGGVNCEWFTIDPRTGNKFLIKGADAGTDPAAMTAYTGGLQTKAYVSKVIPAHGFTGAATNQLISITLANGTASTVVAAKTDLYLDGVKVVSGASSTVTYQITNKMAFNTLHTNTLVWTESGTPQIVHTNEFTFRVKQFGLDDLCVPGVYVIEIEDFDFGGGQSLPNASVMPYKGGEYAFTNAAANATAAIRDVDYYISYDSGDAGSQAVYRTNYVTSAGAATYHFSMSTEGNGTLGTTRPGATGPYTVNAGYKIGWGGTHWLNYTRTIPAGVYTAVMSTSRDPAALIKHSLGEVTSGVGTTTQTVRSLGIMQGTPPGGWSVWGLCPMVDDGGNTTVFKLAGGKTTLRYTQVQSEGDMDWFALVPVSTAAPGYNGVTPPLDLPIKRNQTITWTAEEFSYPIDTNTIALTVSAPGTTTITKGAGGIVNIAWTPTGLLDIGKSYTWSLTVKDTQNQGFTKGGSFIANYMPSTPDGSFVIEAEDFNFGGGQTLPIASTMPYLGGAYELITPIAVLNTDYAGPASGSFDGWIYRTNMDNAVTAPPVPMSSRTGTGNWGYNSLRAQPASGDWIQTTNYAIGWGDQGRWYNYTRSIPAGKYQVWAGQSYGDRSDNNMRGDLYTVSDPTSATPTLTQLGVFRSAGSGGWGDTMVIPMYDTSTNKTAAVEVDLGGSAPTTLRYAIGMGDFDYIVLVKVGGGAEPPTLSGITSSGGSLQISFSGGTLQSSPTLPATSWTDEGTTSPVTVNPGTTGAKFYRVRQ